MATANPSLDLRGHPRYRVLKDGKLVSMTLQCAVNVSILDLSVGGARIRMPACAEFPEKFYLLVVSEKLLYPAITRWRRGEHFGIEFIGEPRPAGLRKWTDSAPAKIDLAVASARARAGQSNRAALR